MSINIKPVTLIAMALGMSAALGAEALKDGTVPLPKNYTHWATFLKDVQRPDAKQVRELYVNSVGAKAKEGGVFPVGTTFVMENHEAVPGATGAATPGAIVRIFVMQKIKGTPEGVPDGLQNGSWVYGSFTADGKPAADDFQKCRACHLPVASKDFVQRYDEYFKARAAGANK
jgi:hemoglobin